MIQFHFFSLNGSQTFVFMMTYLLENRHSTSVGAQLERIDVGLHSHVISYQTATLRMPVKKDYFPFFHNKNSMCTLNSILYIYICIYIFSQLDPPVENLCPSLCLEIQMKQHSYWIMSWLMCLVADFCNLACSLSRKHTHTWVHRRSQTESEGKVTGWLQKSTKSLQDNEMNNSFSLVPANPGTYSILHKPKQRPKIHWIIINT